MLAYHTLYANRDLLQGKFEEKNVICINCTNSDRPDDFFYLCSEKSEKHDEHLNNHKSWMKFFASGKNSMGFFCLCDVEACQSE